MKSLLTLLLLSSAWMACAQDYASPEPVEIGKELSRTTFVIYPTAEEAAAGSREASKYFTPLTEWEKTTTEAGTEFSTKFTVPFAWVNRQVLLHVEWASSAYEIRLNGKVAGYCQNGSNPADYNFTKQVREGANNLTIKVLSNPASTVLESWAHPSEPALGSCYVFSQPTIRIRDLFTKTYRNGSVFNGEVGIVVKTDALNPKKAKIHYELLTPQDEVVTYGSQEIELDMRREDTLRLVAQIPDTMVWSARNPILYTLRLKTQTEGRYTEYVSLKVGFRTVGNTRGQLAINGYPAALKAVPDLGTTVSPSQLLEWKEQGYNLILLPAGGVSGALYDLCDRYGFYVVEQAPINTSRSGMSRRKGGNPSNDPAWQAAYIARIEESYHTTKLHPCVVAFSLAEDSANGINLYEGYLHLKGLEKERPVLYPDAGGEWNSDKLRLSAEQ